MRRFQVESFTLGRMDAVVENVLLKELYVEPKTKQEAEVNEALKFDNTYLGLIAPCHVQISSDRFTKQTRRLIIFEQTGFCH